MNITAIVSALIAVLVSIVLHELMHAFVAYKLGDDTAKADGRITLNPLAHIDPVTTVALPVLLVAIGLPPFGAAKPVMINPARLKGGEWGSALVAVAGPLTNLVLAVIGAVVFGLAFEQLNDVLRVGLGTFIAVNVGFFVFNMIPFPPLDGSRVLYAIAPDGVRKVMQSIEMMGFMAIIIFMFVFYAFLIEPFRIVTNWILDLLTTLVL